VYVSAVRMAKRQKTLTLSDEVAKRLSEEPNQSAKIEELLREDYDL